MKHLLIISCSGRKDKSEGKMPAIDRYTGVFYSVIKKLKREGKFPGNVDVLIISAKFGLLKPNEPIGCYDLKMNSKQAIKLNKNIISALGKYLEGKEYGEVFINLGKDYMLSVSGYEELLPKNAKIILAEGGIGQKMSQMKKWLIRKKN